MLQQFNLVFASQHAAARNCSVESWPQLSQKVAQALRADSAIIDRAILGISLVSTGFACVRPLGESSWVRTGVLDT